MEGSISSLRSLCFFIPCRVAISKFTGWNIMSTRKHEN
jgi:hypothetical protein